jgi:adenylate cyclase
MEVLRRLAERLSTVGAEPGMPPEVRLRQGGLILACVAVAALSWVWIAIYAALGLWLAAAIPFAFVVLTSVDLVILARTRRYAAFRRIQLAAMLALPFLLQWVLGGFVASSAVAIWAFVAALAAIFFSEAAAGLWFAVFVVGTVTSALLEPFIAPGAPIVPVVLRTAFFALNILAVGVVTWAVTGYFVRQRELALRALDAEHARSESLLLNILPRPIADRLKAGATLIADAHPQVTVLFADVVDFTPLARRTAPAELVGLLDRVFTRFDGLADRHGLEKIKTIGDAYMVVGGAPEARSDDAEAIAAMALDMVDAIRTGEDGGLELRIGIDTGPVVAGVIGRRKFTYDLWGDVVNTASRMESHGVPGRIQVTAAVEARLRGRFAFEPRGPIEVKGKGRVEAFFLVGRLGA